MGLLGHMISLFLVFEGKLRLFSIVAAPIYIPTNSVTGLPLELGFCTFSPTFIICTFFDDGHSTWREVINISL